MTVQKGCSVSTELVSLTRMTGKFNRRDIKLDVYDWKEEGDEVLTKWRFSCVLDLPWRPLLAAAGVDNYACQTDVQRNYFALIPQGAPLMSLRRERSFGILKHGMLSQGRWWPSCSSRPPRSPRQPQRHFSWQQVTETQQVCECVARRAGIFHGRECFVISICPSDTVLFQECGSYFLP